MERRILQGLLSLVIVFILAFVSVTAQAEDVRFRARDLGIEIGRYSPGEYNAITDVPGVLVGQKTVWKDPPEVPDISHRVRSGVTAILPHGGNMYYEKVPCASYLANAYGKLAGHTQVKELGELETPILLTGTLNVPKVADALIAYMIGLPGLETLRSVNPVVGETNDGSLNDLRSRPVEEQDVRDAIADAKTGPVLEGSVGAGTGTSCLGYKGGIGTASRVVTLGYGPDAQDYTVGVLVQTNFGGDLTVNGAPVGRALRTSYTSYSAPQEEGSCMVIVATDVPLDSRNLYRLAKRAMYGLIRAGGYSSNGSGDYIIAFSTAYTLPYDGPVELLHSGRLSRLFRAVKEAAEEAVLNSMFIATTVVGRDDNTRVAISLEDVINVCEHHDVLFFHSKVYPSAPRTKEGTVEDGAMRLEQLLGYVSSPDIDPGTQNLLLSLLDKAIEKNSKALDRIQDGDEKKANKELKKCRKEIEAFKSLVEQLSVQEPYASMFISRANLGTWICDKAIALPIE